jgi:hypothetical protein
MVPRRLKGTKLDENFAEIRDVCAYYCNGSKRTKPQLGAFIISLPFTFIYHANAFSTTFVYYLLGVSTQQSQFPSPVTTSIFISNITLLLLWCFGGKVGFILTTATTIFNQNFYNALLFKRGLRDFMLSFIFGNVLVIQDKRPEDITHTDHAKSNPTAHKIEQGRHSMKGEKSTQDRSEKCVSFENDGHSISTNSNSLVENKAKEAEPGICVSMVDKPNFQEHPSSPQNEGSMSVRQLKHLTTVAAESNNKEDSDRTKHASMKLTNNAGDPARESLKETRNEATKNDNLLQEFLNPSDVHFDLDNHPGTVTFRNAISDAIEKFPMKSYTFRKHNWLMQKLSGRYFFIKEDGKRRRKLGRHEIKKKCKLLHDKQILLRSEIAGILSDLKDLKKNHTTSKSNSDHSRNSRTIPLEINENFTGIRRTPAVGNIGKIKKGWMSKVPIAAADSVSLAKDSNVESQVESSKESTISTLTQSNGAFSPDSIGARSTPWIEGPTDQLRELNEPTPNQDSTHIREAITGLLQYTSWLENLNPLRESQIEISRDPRSNSKTKHQNLDKISSRHNSGIITEEKDEINTGEPEAGKDAYWRSLVDDTTNAKTNKAKGRKMSSQDQNSGMADDDLFPKTINLNRNFKKSIDAVDAKSPNTFPLWRRAFQKVKKQGCASAGNIMPANIIVSKRCTSLWRKTKHASVPGPGSQNSVNPVPISPSEKNNDVKVFSINKQGDWVLNLENDERIDSESRDYRGRKKSSNQGNYEVRQDQLMPAQKKEYNNILRSIHHQSFLEKWEDDSCSLTHTQSAVSSKHVLLDLIRDPTAKSPDLCYDSGCNPMEGFTGACVLHNTPSDHDDIYENE